jgi:hypothetical protein
MPLTPFEVNHPELASFEKGTDPANRTHSCTVCGTPTSSDPSLCDRCIGNEADRKAADDEAKAENAQGDPDDTAAPDQPEPSVPAANDADLSAQILDLLDNAHAPLTVQEIADCLRVNDLKLVAYLVRNVLCLQIATYPGGSADQPARFWNVKSARICPICGVAFEHQGVYCEACSDQQVDRVFAAPRREFRLADFQAAPGWQIRLKALREKYPDRYLSLVSENCWKPNRTDYQGAIKKWIVPGSHFRFDSLFCTLGTFARINAVGKTYAAFQCILTENKQIFKREASSYRIAYLDALRDQRLAARNVAMLLENTDRQYRMIAVQNKQISALTSSLVSQQNIITKQGDVYLSTSQNLLKLRKQHFQLLGINAERTTQMRKIKTRRDNWRAKYEALVVSDELWITRYNAQLAELESLKSEIADLKAAAYSAVVEQLPSLTTTDATQSNPVAAADPIIADLQ